MGIRSDDSDGSSYDFNGAAALRNEPLTMMLWTNHYTGGGDPGDSGTVFGVWGASGTRAWRLSVSSGPLEYRARVSFDGAAQNSTSSSTTISLDVWNHVGMTFDGTDLEFYLNGVLDATSVQVGAIFASALDLGVGGFSGGGNECDVDTADCRVYDRILTAAEFETIYASRGHDGITAGLIARSQCGAGTPGALITAVNPAEISASQLGFAAAQGAPVAQYVDNGGLSFRKAA